MRRLNPADELAEIRAEIARLQRREAALEAAILRDPPVAGGAQPVPLRPGWPIRRSAQSSLPLPLH